MAISVSAPKIGLRLVGMADGSTAIMTERGELLERQGGISINSTPGGETIATVEFLVDHDKVRLEKPDEHVDIPGFTANIRNLCTEEEKEHWDRVAERFIRQNRNDKVGE